MIVHTLIGARAPTRSDGEAWISVRVEESATQDGTFTPVATLDIDESDQHDLTFESDSAEAWFRLVFIDADGDTSPPTDPVFDDGDQLLVRWQPTVADVGALLRARTKVPGGGEVGTFTDETRATAEAVENLIRQAVRRVMSKLDGVSPCNDELRDDAGSAAALYAAMLVEQSYYPEQTTNAGSSFKSLQSLWTEQIKDLSTAVAQVCGTGGGEGDTGARPRATFDDCQLIGRLGPEW